jgi:hypothetical protein
MLSSIAQVEPLPFVPATWMKRSFSCGLPASAASLKRVFQPEIRAEQTQAVKKLDGFGVSHRSLIGVVLPAFVKRS